MLNISDVQYNKKVCLIIRIYSKNLLSYFMFFVSLRHPYLPPPHLLFITS